MTSLGPLRQGQRLDTSETKQCSSKEHKPPKHTRASPAHMHTLHTPPEQVPILGTNRLGRFPKQVRPVPPKPVSLVTKISQTNLVQQITPPKSQKCKRNAQAPL
jgi:hypothetical protein